MTLLNPSPELKKPIDRVLNEAEGRPAQIATQGHGLHKQTPVDSVRRLVDYVHERTQETKATVNKSIRELN